MDSSVFHLRYGFAAALILALDQGIKSRIRRLPIGVSAFRIPGIVEITHQINTGAAFSLLTGKTTIILLLSCILLPLIIFLLVRDMQLSSGAKTALAFLVGGSLGNLVDRLFWSGVVDYIRLLFLPFPVFNFADICITFAVGILAYGLLTGKMDRRSGENHHGSSH